MFKEMIIYGSPKKDITSFEYLIDNFSERFYKLDRDLYFPIPDLWALERGSMNWVMRSNPERIFFPYNSAEDKTNTLYIRDDSRMQERCVGQVTVPKMVIGNLKDWPSDHVSIQGSNYSTLDDLARAIDISYREKFARPFDDDNLVQAYKLENFISYEEPPIY